MVYLPPEIMRLIISFIPMHPTARLIENRKKEINGYAPFYGHILHWKTPLTRRLLTILWEEYRRLDKWKNYQIRDDTFFYQHRFEYTLPITQWYSKVKDEWREIELTEREVYGIPPPPSDDEDDYSETEDDIESTDDEDE